MVHNGEEDIEAGAFITGKYRERRGEGEGGKGREVRGEGGMLVFSSLFLFSPEFPFIYGI